MINLFISVIYIDILIFFAVSIFHNSMNKYYKSEIGIAPYIAALLIPPFAFLSPHISIFHVFCFLLVPVLAKRTKNILPVYIISLLTLPFISEKFSLGGIYILDYSVAHSLNIGAFLSLILKSKDKNRSKIVTDIPFLLLISTLFFGVSRDTSITNILREFFNYALDIVLPYIIISRGIRNVQDARNALLSAAAAAIVLSFICTFEALKGWPFYRMVWQHYGIDLLSGANVKLRGGLLRAPGPYPEPLSLSFSLTMCVLAFASCRKCFRSRLWFLALCGIAFLGILAPQARGAWIGLLAALLVADIYRDRWRVLATRISILTMGGLLVIAAGTVNRQIADLAGMTDDGRSTLDYRQQLLDRGFEEVLANPIIGRPFPEVITSMADLTQGEGIVDFVNSYLYVALITGLIGLGIFLSALVMQGTLIWKIKNKTLPTGMDRDHLTFAFSALIGSIIMLSSTSIGGRPLITLAIIMAFAGSSINIARSRKRGIHSLEHEASK